MNHLHKLILFFLFIALLSANMFSQKVIFNSPKLINKQAFSKARKLITGNIDNDNNPDILIASSRNNTIAYLINEPESPEHFSSLQIISNTFDKAGLISIADIDNDGDNDIIAGSERDNKISWFENTGGVNDFSIEHKKQPGYGGLTAVVPFDIDEDGDLDLVLAFWENPRISYLENKDGKGDFMDEKIIDNNVNNVSQLLFSDIDNDGKKDLVASLYSDNKLAWYKNEGSGNFSDPHYIDDNVNNPFAIYAADLDNDGDSDLIASIKNKVVWYKNDGLGNFSDSIEVYDKNYSIETILTKDLDNDGDQDIIIGNSEAGKILCFENTDGTGTFGEETAILSNFPGAYSFDFNNFTDDNILDFCALSYYDNKLVWIPDLDISNITSPVTIVESELQEPRLMISTDFAGDNASDIVVSNYRTNSLILYKNKNAGQSYEYKIIDQDAGPKERIFTSSDLDKNGRTDIIEARKNYAYSTLNWYKNINEIGEFSINGIVANDLPPVSYLTAADMDGDSLDDIIIVSETGNKLVYLKNKGQGKFEKNLVVISDQTQNPSMAIVNDFNNDGTNDIIVSSYSENYIYLFTNNNGNFTLQQASIPNQVNTSEKIIIKDLDQDGDMDIVVMDKNINSVSWFENITGKGDFSTPINIITGIRGLSDISLGYINNDNLPDLLSLSEYENNLYVNIAEKAPKIIRQPQDTAICDVQNITLNIDYDKSDSIRWQVMKSGLNAFEYIYNDSVYQGSTAKNLQIKANPDLDSYKYRCLLFYKNNMIVSDTAELNVFQKVEADAGQDDTTCISYYFLNSNHPDFGIGVWAVLEGNASVEEPAKNYTKVNNLSPGNNIFKWTVTNGLCQDFDEVIIFKLDSIKIIQQPESLSLHQGSTAQFKLTTNTEGDFQWYFNGYELTDNDKIQGSKTSTLTITDIDSTDIGNYRCYAEGYCNNIYSDLATLDIITSTDDLNKNKTVIYPNPVNNILFIKYQKNILQIEIINSKGKSILKLIQNNINNNAINVSGLQPGLYFIKILTKNGLTTRKFMKF